VQTSEHSAGAQSERGGDLVAEARFSAFKTFRLFALLLGVPNALLSLYQAAIGGALHVPIVATSLTQLGLISLAWLFNRQNFERGIAVVMLLSTTLFVIALWAVGLAPGVSAIVIWCCVASAAFYGPRAGVAMWAGCALALALYVARIRFFGAPEGAAPGAVFPLPGIALRYSTAVAALAAATAGTATAMSRGLEASARRISDALARERRERERRVAADHALEEARRLEAVGRLAGGVAHDFNNMLTPILAYAEMLRTQDCEPSEIAPIASVIFDSARRAGELTRQLLQYSRKAPRERKPVAMHTTIRDVIALLARTIDRRIVVRADLDASADTILGDATLLHNALLNLALNARDAMPKGGDLVFTTSVHQVEAIPRDSISPPMPQALPPGRYVQIDVRDTGVGIATDVIDRIFEPFFTTKLGTQGTGLGLAAVYGTVRAHEGSITVESEEGKGTCFTVRLPIAEGVLVPLQPSTLPPIGAKQRGRALVVEDEDIVRRLVVRVLGTKGLGCIEAPDGEAALAAFRENDDLRLIVLDLALPKLSGQEVLKAIRASGSKVPVLILSGSDERVEPDICTTAMKKPFARADLTAQVESMLDW
jgi:signal transduction histidine kinase